MRTYVWTLLLLAAVLCRTLPATAAPFFFSTGAPDGRLAAASRQPSAGKVEIEQGDDFVLPIETILTSATFTGLLPPGVPLSSVREVTVEFYRVFPNDSDASRTSGSPTFSTPCVPTRVNSPADDALTDRDSIRGDLSFTATLLSASFSAANSVVNGINCKPNQTTGGEGPVAGQEVQFNVTFRTPVDLPLDHYFFVPQVRLDSGDFLWLSTPRPLPATGTPFTPDLQAWIRNSNIDPDWLRIGTDIIGSDTFNMAFTLTGTAVCSFPAALGLLQQMQVGGSISATGATFLRNELFTAQAGVAVCANLRCALCIVRSAEAAGRPNASTLGSQLEQQLLCLLTDSRCR